MIPVSVIVATRNEEPRLPRCLAALGAFAEIVVVDSASTDRSAEIARAHGARVIDFIWDGHYPKKRQWCLDRLILLHEWVLFVDADEIMTPELAGEISQLSFAQAGYFIKGRYIWNGRLLGHGQCNNKLALLDRRRMMFPVIDDLDLSGMGEMEGHYQPVLRIGHGRDRPGQLKSFLVHDAAEDQSAWQARHRRYAAWERGMNARASWPQDPVRWRQSLKTLFRAMPCRPLIAFLYGYVWKGGILDGRSGLDFALKRAAYYRMIVNKKAG